MASSTAFNARWLPGVLVAVVLSVCLAARPANAQSSSTPSGASVNPTTAAGGPSVGTDTDPVPNTMTTADPATDVTTTGATGPPAGEGGLTAAQRIIVIAVCACAGGLALVALVASLAYVKVRQNKRRRVAVTAAEPQAQATVGGGNTNESGDRQVLNA